MPGKSRLADADRRQGVFVSHWNLFHSQHQGIELTEDRGLRCRPGEL